MAIQDAVPDIRPRAGHDLLAGIGLVLPRLADTADPAALVDHLTTALVRCTACGDISRVRDEAAAVRRAVTHLRAGDAAQAAAALKQARAGLLTFAPLA
jgi:hypothetical protein